ncbi:MAG: response regulator transcription factor [Pseudomonadota bacterium]
MRRKILVVEDDKDIAHLVQLHLHDLHCDVDLAHDGMLGLARARTQNYDLIILDLMVPGMEGLEVCRRLRTQSNYTPILMLTAKSAELDRVLGLEVGADDYLTKPFSIRELLARVKAILRRMEALAAQPSSTPPQLISVGDLTIDTEKRRVMLRGRPVELTAKEFSLLLQFAQHPGKVYTRSQLLDLVWNYGHDGYEHTVNSHINRLRAKIESDPARPDYIRTVWGVGYKFAEPQQLTQRD